MNRYTIEEKEWLKRNYSVLGSKKCAEHLDRPLAGVRQLANHMGCFVPLSLQNQLHSQTLVRAFSPTILPDTFREVKTKETAYVLGILWADGWVQNKTDYSINIKLVTEDMDKIEWIFYKLGEWRKYSGIPPNRKPTTQLRVSGKSLVDYLLEIDYHSKSNSPATKVINSIPSQLLKYWWRGYFDGDGHIHASHPYRMEFSSAWNQDWSFLPPEYPFKISITRGKHSYSRASLNSKTESIHFGNMIWEGWDGIGLPRKYKEFKKLF